MWQPKEEQRNLWNQHLHQYNMVMLLLHTHTNASCAHSKNPSIWHSSIEFLATSAFGLSATTCRVGVNGGKDATGARSGCGDGGADVCLWHVPTRHSSAHLSEYFCCYFTGCYCLPLPACLPANLLFCCPTALPHGRRAIPASIC